MLKKSDIAALKLQAAECSREHICLVEPGDVLGEVTSCINNKVLFVKQHTDSFCAYKNCFGNSFFCTCPVRMKIYQESGNLQN